MRSVDKEPGCDYYYRLNGYTRNVGVQFENGRCEAKDHVEHFLDTCDDRALKERLCNVRVKGIHDRENIINDILKCRDRKKKRDSSVRASSGQAGSHRQDNSQNEDSRSSYCRDSHHRDGRRRNESPYRPIITLTDALSDLVTALTETFVVPQTNQSRSYDHGYEMTADSYGDTERQEDEDRTLMYEYAGEDERGHVPAANDIEHRVAAEGAFVRSDNQLPESDGNFNNDRGPARNNHSGRKEYGPCAACGYLTHSVHYKRCKLRKQVHDPGKCELSTSSLVSSGRRSTKRLCTDAANVVNGNHFD
ncbi:hypothetical protein PHMEG_00017031 [Phytophthora megakarya]|uniref:Uncharacterized protein n=1 Tax=Phytophthora megakarya TaxID=4795 RepID=A0A225VXK8_9STRA|nr:hypothetical protein PHMEG_00017031 [Phytophthora megakarya]